MNKAEKMIISEKFENVINSIPDSEEGDKPRYVLAKYCTEFRELMKAL